VKFSHPVLNAAGAPNRRLPKCKVDIGQVLFATIKTEEPEDALYIKG
jgi:hypothetical protein